MVTIYAIVDKASGIVGYVGATANLPRRVKQHLSGRSNHRKDIWLASLGYNVDFVVLEKVESGMRDEAERYWVEHYRRVGVDLYNETDGGSGMLGRPHKETTKQRISKGNRGKKRTSEMVAAMELRVSNPSPETRERMSAAKRGKRLDAEAKANLSMLLMGNQRAKGYRHTPEALAKISQSSKLKKPFMGRKHTDESKALMSEFQRKKVNSPETIEKMKASQQAMSAQKSAAMKAYWANKKMKSLESHTQQC